MDISGPQLRAVRAALFTAVVVTLSTASHVLLSGAPLPLSTVALIGAAVFALAYALAGRERSFGRIAALLIPLELAADTVFTTGQHVCYGRMGGPVAGPLRAVGFDVLCGDGTGVGVPLARVTGHAAEGGDRVAAVLAEAGPATAWLLLGAHIGVGLLAAAWLRPRGAGAGPAAGRGRGDGVDGGPSAAAGRRGGDRAPAAEGGPAGPYPHRAAVARTLLLAHSLGRRGPPCSLAA